MNKFVVLVISMFSECTSGIFGQISHRLNLFDDTRTGQRLQGQYNLQVHFMIGRIRCAKLCTFHPPCMSFNYFKSKTCELLTGDSFSVRAVFAKDPGSNYVGMKNKTLPVCYEDGAFRDIKDDSPSVCQINLKRHDAQWGVWGPGDVIEDSRHEYRMKQSRDCPQPPAHGGSWVSEFPRKFQNLFI